MLAVCTKIVAPYDYSEASKNAIKKAAAIAKTDEKIELKIITVVEPAPTGAYFNLLEIKGTREEVFIQAKNELKEVQDALSELANPVTAEVLQGSPQTEIVNYAKEADADLIVMGSRGLTGLKEMFLGSVSHFVVQKSPCPVFIVK